MHSFFRSFIIVITVTFLNFCHSQDELILNTEDDSNSNIYYYSMRSFLDNLENSIESQKEKDSVVFKELNDYFKEIYILKSDFTSKSLANIDNPRFVFLNSKEELKSIMLKEGMKKRIKIVPLRKDKDYFFVNILMFHCNVKDDRLECANASGTRLNFKFNSDSNNFIFIKSK